MRRPKELDLEHLQYIGLGLKWFCTQYEIARADLETLLYLNPIKFFTVKDFEEGVYHYSWNNDRFYRLKRNDWFKQIYKGNRRKGESDKYVLSSKAERMIRRLGRILDGQEEFPLSTRNKLVGSDKYSHKVLLTSIKKKKENGKKSNN